MNDATQYIGTALTVAIVSVLATYLPRFFNSPAATVGGKRRVAYPTFLRVFALATMTIPIVLLYPLLTASDQDRMAILGIMGLFSALGIPLVMEFFGTWIDYDDDTIQCHSAWRRQRTIIWDDTQAPRYSALMQWWSIPTTKSGFIRIHQYLQGGREFLEYLTQKQLNTEPERGAYG